MVREIKFRAFDLERKKMYGIAGLSWRELFSYGEPERFTKESIQSFDLNTDDDKLCWIHPYEPSFPMSGIFSNELAEEGSEHKYKFTKEYEEYSKECKEKLENHKKNLENYIIMQYTGLKDKNGKEIYEGDIVSMVGEKYSVEFEYGSFVVSGMTFQQLDTSDLEIIGNIWENPELLTSPSPTRE